MLLLWKWQPRARQLERGYLLAGVAINRQSASVSNPNLLFIGSWVDEYALSCSSTAQRRDRSTKGGVLSRCRVRPLNNEATAWTRLTSYSFGESKSLGYREKKGADQEQKELHFEGWGQ